MALPEFVMDFIEFLYDYKQLPGIFFLHLVLVGLMGTYLVYLFWTKSNLKAIETNPNTQPSRCHDHMRYIDFMNEKKRTTESEV